MTQTATAAAVGPVRIRGRLRRTILRMIFTAAAVLPLLIISPPSAQALGNDPIASPASTRLTHAATPDTNPFDLPNAELTLALVQGEGVWLHTTGLEASTTFGSDFPDPGAAFIVKCYGPGIASQGTGWYAARNLDPPNNQFTFRPQIRAMFVAPASGQYTCKVLVAAYQPRTTFTVPVTFSAGAVLHATPVKPTSSVGVTAGYGWTVPDSGSAPQPYISSSKRTLRHDYGNYTFQRPSSPTVTIAMDQNVTTCSTGDTFAGCPSPGVFGETEVRVQVVAQPQHLDGSACGVSSPMVVFDHTLTVIGAYHHYPLLTTAVLDKATGLRGCPRVNMAMDLTWISGQPLVIHTQRPNDQRPGWGGIYEHG